MWKFETYKASWLESFDLLKSDSMTLLLLVSFKTLTTVYRSMLRAWFLPLTLLAGLVLNIPRLLCAFYTTIIVRSSRPSIDYKNASYWQKTVVADWIIFFAVILLVYLPQFWAEQDIPSTFMHIVLYCYDLLMRLLFLARYDWLPGTQSLGVFSLFLSPFLIIWLLFLLDAQLGFWSSIKAFGRAVLMLSYNYPFFLIIYVIIRLLLSCLYVLLLPLTTTVPAVAILGWLLLLGILVPYWICLLTNFYVKRLHEQFGLYYRS